MNITSAELIISAVRKEQYPDDNLPEFAMVGRSNVGKSSLINALLRRKNLARTSQSPGKTQTINFYLVNRALYLVDLPGYGYAQVSWNEREKWRKMIEEYLLHRANLRGIIQLVDIRHPPTRDDLTMTEWLRHFQKPFIVIATKADKISRGQWAKHLRVARETLKLPPEGIIPFSAVTGYGRDEVWAALQELMLDYPAG